MTFESEPGLWRVDNPEEICLREYQHQSIAALRANIKAGIDSQILASMAGSGKTVMAAYLLHECWQKGKRGMFIVDRLNLLDQTSAVFDRYGIPHGIVQASHPRYRPGELIQVASIQTLAKRGWPEAQLIICDEAHILYLTMAKRIAKGGAKIIGLTATPFTRGLGKHYKAIVNVTTGNKLTADGFLVPFKVWAAKEPDMKGVKTTKFGEWEEEETSKRAVKIIGDVVREYQTHGEGRKFIGFGVDVAHCEALHRQFLGAGINVSLYTYLTDDYERSLMLHEFRKPDSAIRGLISVSALSRGFDVPDVACIIMCRPLKASFAEFIQIIGRGSRSHPLKKDCYILDLAGNFERHYPAMVEFFEEGAQSLDDGKPKPKRIAMTPEAKKPRKCPRCKYLPVVGMYCPSCGFIYPPKKSIEHESGALGEFDGSRAIKMDRAAKMTLHAELSYYCQMKKWKPGWIAHTYRRITGVWPCRVDNGTLPPSGATLAVLAKMYPHHIQKPATGHVAPANGILELDIFA